MGRPRIHGELLKLGMDVGQTTVAKYMPKRRRPPSEGWRTFVHNHADVIASRLISRVLEAIHPGQKIYCHSPRGLGF
jgi:hypothetical protein